MIVEMDADGSHAPEHLPALLAALGPDGADVVLGSRYVPGRLGGQLARATATGSPGAATCTPGWPSACRINDITGGYRVFRREVLGDAGLDDVESQGYCFQVDLAWRAVQAGFSVVEVPITFTERERGGRR